MPHAPARNDMPRDRGWRPDVEARITLDERKIADFCARWRVSSLELFGSILREDFRPESDVDMLVTFQPDADWGLLDHAAMEEELGDLLGRRVDLLTRRSVERSANPLLRASILANAMPLFAAPDSVATAATESTDGSPLHR